VLIAVIKVIVLPENCYHLKLDRNVTWNSKCFKLCCNPNVQHETWSILREEHLLLVFENRVLRRVFGPKREEMVGGWRRLHSEDLHNLYILSNIIRVINEGV
jgi:hypothetical protein